MGSLMVSQTLHTFLKEQKQEGESFEDCIIRLLKIYPVSDWEIERKIGISLSSETKDLIREYRITDGEGLENILTRLLLK